MVFRATALPSHTKPPAATTGMAGVHVGNASHTKPTAATPGPV